jgi:Skp family chaperone for outer membrane proteins
MEGMEKDLNKELELAQSKMNNKKVQLEAKIQEYESSKDTISEQKSQKMRKEIHSLQRELKYLEAELREDLGLMQQEMNVTLLSQANDIVAQYAKDNKIDLVLRNSPEVVVYAPEAKDITTAVIETLVQKGAKTPVAQEVKDSKKK